ncbi:hypothetical protein L6Q96_03890 [Candidatus Binatia bacterium]|nr:hypothetical protein [Candidatus Binatia bacterium]
MLAEVGVLATLVTAALLGLVSFGEERVTVTDELSKGTLARQTVRGV